MTQQSNTWSVHLGQEIHSFLWKQLDSYIRTLCAQIIHDKLTSEKEIMERWKMMMDKFGKQNEDGPQCEHLSKENKQCVSKVSNNSQTKKYCNRHFKQHEQPKAQKSKKEKKQCVFAKCGKDRNNPCKNKVCKDSEDYCVTHHKLLESE